MALDEETIENAAAKAKSVTVDGQTIGRRDLSELIAADQYLGQKAAARKSNLGIRMGQLRNRGTT